MNSLTYSLVICVYFLLCDHFSNQVYSFPVINPKENRPLHCVFKRGDHGTAFEIMPRNYGLSARNAVNIVLTSELIEFLKCDRPNESFCAS